jgi:hypothetical protein
MKLTRIIAALIVNQQGSSQGTQIDHMMPGPVVTGAKREASQATTALNLLRMLNWLLGAPVARTRGSRFQQLLTPSRLWAEGMRKRYREVCAPRTIDG